MNIIKLTLLSLILTSCNSASNNETSNIFWEENSKKIVILQDNGNTPDPDDRYTEYVYTSETLTVDAKLVLPTIHSVTEPLYCSEDGVTYEITVTNEADVETMYYSNNSVCQEILREHYVKVEDIESLIPLLLTY